MSANNISNKVVTEFTYRFGFLQVLAGGHVVQHPSGGQFFAPTVLVNITPDMRIWR